MQTANNLFADVKNPYLEASSGGGKLIQLVCARCATNYMVCQKPLFMLIATAMAKDQINAIKRQILAGTKMSLPQMENSFSYYKRLEF